MVSVFAQLGFRRETHLRDTSDAWYQSFYAKKKKGKNAGWNARNLTPIDTTHKKK